MTEYFVQRSEREGSEITNLRTKLKKEAFEKYHEFCEEFPKEKFLIVKRIITEEIIAESEDVRQARFDFA